MSVSIQNSCNDCGAILTEEGTGVVIYGGKLVGYVQLLFCGVSYVGTLKKNQFLEVYNKVYVNPVRI